MTTTTYHLEPDATIPNNIHPLIVMSAALDGDDAEAIAERFRRNGWQGTWVYTVFDYWHYHVEGHEVLGCARGSATIGFGGDDGIAVDMRPGDVVVIPAGVGHKRLAASSDFAVVGAYPPGQNGAITRAGAMHVDAAAKQIAEIARPTTDPVTGETFDHWHDG